MVVKMTSVSRWRGKVGQGRQTVQGWLSRNTKNGNATKADQRFKVTREGENAVGVIFAGLERGAPGVKNYVGAADIISDYAQAIEDCGIHRDTAHKYQKLASLDEAELEDSAKETGRK